MRDMEDIEDTHHVHRIEPDLRIRGGHLGFHAGARRQRDSGYMGERYSVSQMFLWFGKLVLKEDIAGEEAKAERYEAARLELIDQVTSAWFEDAWPVECPPCPVAGVQSVPVPGSVRRSGPPVLRGIEIRHR